MLKNCQFKCINMFNNLAYWVCLSSKMKHKWSIFRCFRYWKVKLLLWFYPGIMILIFQHNFWTVFKTLTIIYFFRSLAPVMLYITHATWWVIFDSMLFLNDSCKMQHYRYSLLSPWVYSVENGVATNVLYVCTVFKIIISQWL